jgi:hypothetical protein
MENLFPPCPLCSDDSGTVEQRRRPVRLGRSNFPGKQTATWGQSGSYRSLKDDSFHRFGKMDFLVPDFERINKAAYWDYQREKIQIIVSTSDGFVGRYNAATGTAINAKFITLPALVVLRLHQIIRVDSFD